MEKYLEFLLSFMGKKEKYKIFNPYEYFIKNYKTYEVIEGLPKKEIKRCFNNSIESLDHNTKYIEGWIILHGVPLNHAWNLVDNISTDFTLKPKKENTYYGIEIPNEIILMAVSNKYWTLCSGVIQTIFHFDKKQLEEINKIFREFKENVTK